MSYIIIESLRFRIDRYLQLAVTGVRSAEMAHKIRFFQ